MTEEQFALQYNTLTEAAKNNKIIESNLNEKCRIQKDGNKIIISFRIFRCTYYEIRELQNMVKQCFPDMDIICNNL